MYKNTLCMKPAQFVFGFIKQGQALPLISVQASSVHIKTLPTTHTHTHTPLTLSVTCLELVSDLPQGFTKHINSFLEDTPPEYQ